MPLDKEWFENLVVQPSKVLDYLLSATSEEGRHKRAFFLAHGFADTRPRELADALMAHAAAAVGLHDTDAGPWWLRRPLHYRVSCEERTAMKEHDRVVLARDLPDEGLVEGDLGTIVGAYVDGNGYEVEFMTLDGDTIAVVTLSTNDLRLTRPTEVAHARALA